MKSLFVTLSATATASPFDKGTRVVAKFEGKTWLVGTVSANRMGRVYVKFDNGEAADYGFTTKNVLKIEKLRRKVKDELTEKQAQKLFKEFNASIQTTSRVAAAKAKMKAKVKAKAKTADKGILIDDDAGKKALKDARPDPVPSKVLSTVQESAPKVKTAQPSTPIKAAKPVYAAPVGGIKYKNTRNLQSDTGAPDFFSKADYDKLTFLGSYIDTRGESNFPISALIGFEYRNMRNVSVYEVNHKTLAYGVIRSLNYKQVESEVRQMLDHYKAAKPRLIYEEFVKARTRWAEKKFEDAVEMESKQRSVLDIKGFKINKDLIGLTAHMHTSVVYPNLPASAKIISVNARNQTLRFQQGSELREVSFNRVYELMKEDLIVESINR